MLTEDEVATIKERCVERRMLCEVTGISTKRVEEEESLVATIEELREALAQAQNAAGA